MSVSKWKPLDQKAIMWWAANHDAKIQPPFAWPQVTFLLEDGCRETKLISHLRLAYEKFRKENKGRGKPREDKDFEKNS